MKLSKPASPSMLGMLRDERSLRALFRLSLLFKAALSILEIIGGLLAWFVTQSELVHVVLAITQQELTEDPDDFIATRLVAAAQGLSIGTQHFVAFYLLSHGLLKTWLIVGLLREKLGYYPIAMLIFAAFVAYQLFRFQLTHSWWLLLLTIVDLVVIGLTWHEYRYLSATTTRSA